MTRPEFFSAPWRIDAGRCLVYEDTPIATLHKIGTDAKGYTMDACDMDDFAALVVRALNRARAKPTISSRAEKVTAAWHEGTL
jgi:hypothetical protein